MKQGRQRPVAAAGASTDPRHPEALPSEELFETSSNRALALGAAQAGLVALGSIVFWLGRVPFALVYTAYLGLAIVLVGTTRYVVDQRHKDGGTRGDAGYGALFLSIFWLLFVLVPVMGVWARAGNGAGDVVTAVTAAAPRILLLVAVLAVASVAEARRYASRPPPPGPTLAKPFLRRALSVAAFVIFGPGLCHLLTESAVPEPVAVAATFALSESYPFAATLVDRWLHR